MNSRPVGRPVEIETRCLRIPFEISKAVQKISHLYKKKSVSRDSILSDLKTIIEKY